MSLTDLVASVASNEATEETKTGGEQAPILGADVPVSSLEMRTLCPETFLYGELARLHLGERAEIVALMLLNKGRLTVSELSQGIPELSTKSIKTILVSLIQLRCVMYLEEKSMSGRQMTYYYFNREGFQLMLYAGDIVSVIESYFEDESARIIAVQIVQNVLALGSLATKDYLSSMNMPGVHVSEIVAMFVKLVELGFLVPLSAVHYTPVGDLWSVLYKREYNAIPKTSVLSDAKKRAEAKAKTKQHFSKILKSTEFRSVLTTDPQTSLRKVKETVPLTFDLQRYMKNRRSRHLVQLAKSRVGTVPSIIYQTALKITELHSPSLFDPLCKTGLLQELEEKISIEEDRNLDDEKLPGVTFNAVDISRHLPDIDLRGSLVSEQRTSKRPTQQSEPQKRMKTEDGFVVPQNPLPPVLEEAEDYDEDQNELLMADDSALEPRSLELINGHLKLLATASIPFLIESKPGLYFVPYSKIIPLLKTAVYDCIIASTVGPSAHRILRCVRDNNLVSEKVINNTALMKERDIRSVVATLVRYNALEIVEVPRTVDRAASRAVFLFRIHEQHAFDFMKQNLTWNIANSIHKIEILKEENATLLKKAQREDVKGKEAELLLPTELNQLKLVNERELNSYARRIRLLSLWEVFTMF
ncbi:HHL310Wp [Eremothecium sinecaudum]|uniref:DNA-directed RNA polymerase III subunit RPC3 n=1 Tax=Eremothecium sinecaudum TaxID=45286 RepID=A0A0X8HW23_9SACH|nr:HHL310Wp [Eremothecium sinecaudum]AMD22460.1 HHL310Wp [Eremothecium sinecaudum]